MTERSYREMYFFGLGVVGALDGEVDRFAVLLFAFGVDILHIHHLLFIERRWPLEKEEVVAFLGRYLGRGARARAREADFIDGYFGIVFLAPLLDVSFVEPLVESRDEVHPLQNF